MPKFNVVVKNAGLFCNNSWVGKSVVVFSAHLYQPSKEEIVEAFRDKYGTCPSGQVTFHIEPY